MRTFLTLTTFLLLMGCGAGGADPGEPFDPGFGELSASCDGGVTVIQETDEQAYLQIGGAFDQLRHDEGDDPPVKMTTKIDDFIREFMCENDIPGLGLGIVWHGNLVYVKGYGVARGWGDPDTPDVPVRGQRTRFRWASCSKCLTGVAAVKATQEKDAQDQPYLDLDADLQDNYRCFGQSCAFDIPDSWYPGWFPEDDENPLDWPLAIQTIPLGQANAFTVRRLCANRCGVQHYGEGDPSHPSGVPSEADREANDGFVWAVDEWTGNPCVRLPGDLYNYSSFGFNMAGAAIEMAVPGTYWSYVKSRIADVTEPSPMLFLHPDDVYDPQYDGAPWFTTPNRVHGYSKDSETLEVFVNTVPGDVSYKLPSGGFISTTADMALFVEGLLNNRFLDQAGMDLLLTPQANAVKGNDPAPATGYALGVSVGQRSGERMASHNGGQQDTSTRLLFFPDGEDPSVGKLGIVVMSNALHLSRSAVTNQVEAFLRNPYVPLTAGGGILFNGTDPVDPTFAAQDLTSRNANGPYADDGFYGDRAVDRYGEPVFEIRTGHRFDPNYRPAPPVPSPDPEKDDPPFESPDDPARLRRVERPGG